jgi:hypothetical protein
MNSWAVIMTIPFIRYRRELGMPDKTVVETLVEQVYFLQKVANERFGGFSYGDDYVIRDFVAKRKKANANSSSSRNTEVFRSPMAPLTDEMCNKIFENVKRNYVAEALSEYMSDRNIVVMNLTRS